MRIFTFMIVAQGGFGRLESYDTTAQLCERLDDLLNMGVKPEQITITIKSIEEKPLPPKPSWAMPG